MSFDRVTKASTRQNMLTWLDTSQRRVASASQQVASGKRLNVASDDPAATAEALLHRRQLDRLAQLARNADSARSWVDTSSSALTDASGVLIRSRTTVLQGINGTTSAQGREALAGQLDQLADELVALANTKVAGRSVFAGDADVTAAFQADGTYNGSATPVSRSVEAGQVVAVGQPGTVAFGTGVPADGLNGNAVQVLRAAAEAVRTGNVADMQASLTAIDGANDRLLTESARLGSIQVRLDSLTERRAVQSEDTQRRLTQLEDVDIAEAIINMRSAEASYQATLSATSQLLSTSLLDFLR